MFFDLWFNKMTREVLKKIVTMGAPFLLGLSFILAGCEKKSTSLKIEETTVTNHIVFKNYDPSIYEAFVDGASKGAIPKNTDPINPDWYGTSTVTFTDVFNPHELFHTHMLDFRSGETIHDTKEFSISKNTNGVMLPYCIEDSKFKDCD